LNLTPVFNHAAVFFRPELVAVCLQLCGMAALWRALRRASAWDWHWALAGLSFGAAIYCWAGAVWGLVSVVVLLAGGRRWRRQLIRPGFWILMADAALLVWPVWDWNVENAMAGVDHWREVLLPAGELGVLQVLRLAGKWVLGLTPLVAAAAVWAFGCGVRRWGSSDSGRYFTAFALTPFAGALVVSVGGGGQTAWIAPALPALCGLIAWAWEDALAERIVWKQRLQWLTVLPALILTPVAMEPDVLRLAGMGVSPETVTDSGVSVGGKMGDQAADMATAAAASAMPPPYLGLCLMGGKPVRPPLRLTHSLSVGATLRLERRRISFTSRQPRLRPCPPTGWQRWPLSPSRMALPRCSRRASSSCSGKARGWSNRASG
jgi:hypothetical protein